MIEISAEIQNDISFHQAMAVAELLTFCSKGDIVFKSKPIDTEGISIEHFTAPMNRIIMGENPANGIRFLRDCGILEKFIPELSRCSGIKQNPKYHIDNIFEHCVKVCSLVKQDLKLRWAGLLHDIGKYEAKNITEKAGETFHKHEVFGEKSTRNIMARLGITGQLEEEIVFLVRNHMYHYDRKWTDKTVWKFILKTGLNNSGIIDIGEMPLFLLRRADRASRGLTPISQKQMDFEARLISVFNKNSEREF